MDVIKFVGGILWLILFVWSLVDIVKANKPNGWKLIWVLICLVFPVVGTIVYYLIARQKDMHLSKDFSDLTK